MICLIGARGNSKRIPGKNTRELGGKPLVRWTLRAAGESGCFDEIYISSDDPDVHQIASTACACYSIQRPAELATDDSSDIDWIRHALAQILDCGCNSFDLDLGMCDHREQSFCLLRPTSPFRGPETIRRAVAAWERHGKDYDSLRAVRRASEHPLKQWQRHTEDLEEGVFGISPFVAVSEKKHLHSRPTQSLADAWVQTAGLEIFWRSTIYDTVSYGPYDGEIEGTLSGRRVLGFELSGPEAMDINDESDWQAAEAYLASVGS